MIDEYHRILKIDECNGASAETFHIYKSTWELITKALQWTMGKTQEEIEKRIMICEGKQFQARNFAMKNGWQLMIDSLRWVIGETEINPIESRKNLIPFS